jgi:outer membrane protein OmpA-like peptidoglycan-associated protein
MKKLLLGAFLLSTVLLQAQTVDRRWNVGVHGGFREYTGDLGDGFLQFNPTSIKNTMTFGLSINRYLSRSFDLGIMGNYGAWAYYDANDVQLFKGDLLHLNLAAKFKFYNGSIIEENSVIQPYVLAGAGLNVVQKGMEASSTPGQDGALVLGAGLNFRITEVFGINYQATYAYNLTTDNFDKVSGQQPNDALLTHTIGLNFNMGRTPDEDGDGVMDKKDKCPNTPKTAKVDEFGCPLDMDKDGVFDYQDACPEIAGTVNGCPDRDKDGVEDTKDQCPDLAGPANLNGCPDTDGDGIIDTKDKCPNAKGTLEMNGCPDKDGDGIIDSLDKCPDVKGVKLFEGCPDTDGDSIPDMSDMCPDKKGPLATKGCPDTDLDGVHDGIDKCPTIAGLAANAGCPEIQREVKQLFQKALQGIQFETGKAVIKPQSFGILDAVVKVMKENPSYKLLIGGHTDDVGNDAANMTLSQNRADAVAKYLITHGVDPTRVSATGYGETKPVDTNKTKAGKARNRRVELEVEFIETKTIKE